MSGQMATMLRSIKVIMNATAVFISEVDVRKRESGGKTFHPLETILA